MKELPTLTETQRGVLKSLPSGRAALALIDALTAQMAEMAGQLVAMAEAAQTPCGCATAGRIVTVCDAHAERDAALARAEAAELARDCFSAEASSQRDRAERAECERDAALARAEAANARDLERTQALVNQRDRAERAESEAAALRAELKTALEWNDALRVENERLQGINAHMSAKIAADAHDHGVQLAAANALLERCADWVLISELANELRAHLAGQPAAPTRTAAEQRALDAAEAFVRDWERSGAVPDAVEMPSERALYDAQLARREGK
jgi:hypothetical protein